MKKYKLNGKNYQSENSKINGRKILENADLIPVEDYELLKKINQKGFEPIQLNEVVDLKSPGIEGFIAKPYKVLNIYVDEVKIEVDECFKTPDEILTMAGKNPEEYFLKQLKGQIEIGYKNDRDHKVAIKNGAKFISCKLDDRKVVIIVNGTAYDVQEGDISYNEVVTLAFPDFPQHPERTYSVTYEKGQGNKPSGILSPGGSVTIKDRMVFKVKHTGQS
jgi:hypothetical protein